MPVLHPDPATRKWRWTEPNTFNAESGLWTSRELPASPSAFRGSLFWPKYVAEGTVLTRDVRGTRMPLAANSADMASWMDTNALYTAGGAWGAKTSLNTSVYGTEPIAVYVVDSTAPGVDWQYVDSVSAGAGYNQAEVDLFCKGRIPLPGWVTPPPQGDRGLALYDLGTGVMREYFMFQPVAGKPGHWTARTGGYSVAKPGLVDLAQTNPGLQLRTGSNAVVGMHNALGFLGIAELVAGQVNHAVAFTCSNMGIGPSWPALGADGLSTDPNAPKEGQWFRLPASVDPTKNPSTGKPYNPLTQVIIRAVQRYGGFASDKNLWVHAFNGENGRTWKQLYGKDPWYRDGTDTTGKSDGILVQMYGTTNRSIDVSDFPWHLTEWAPVDWGRPSPDFFLRPGQSAPWQ
ncbi:hypothetical protein [Sinomonas susongensis]|uniref:hypothetical protein n=1 Tax=Sinomonas susongensis TaxID=1324851 RepID=UPI0011099F4E|nr:hypothetical protein [Sinomonas susongensis]